MGEYTFSNALMFNMSELAVMVNRTYEQSFLPLQQTAGELAAYCQYNNMDLGNSLVMREGDNLVGATLLATRGKRGWLGGFGIVPEYRGRGAGKALLGRQLTAGRAIGLTSIQLEAPLESEVAVRLGESMGFITRRDVLDLLLASDTLPQHDSNASISATDAETIMDWLLQGLQPAWTRERINLLIKGGEALTLTRADGSKAALMYRRRGRQGEKVQIYAMALSETGNTLDFLALLHHAAAGATKISIHNEPEGTPLHHACRELGFSEEHRYHEMRHEARVVLSAEGRVAAIAQTNNQ